MSKKKRDRITPIPTPRTAAATEAIKIPQGKVSVSGSQRMSLEAAKAFKGMGSGDRGRIWELGYAEYLKLLGADK